MEAVETALAEGEDGGDVVLTSDEAIDATASGSTDAPESKGLKVAIVGCCHGELDSMYATIEALGKRNPPVRVDLLLCCGDFQAVRNVEDLHCLAVKPKYRRMNTFYKYYSGEKTAPVPTIFIGGNHEASNLLSDLYYGGWVAPNIYYMGTAGVVNYGGLRIGGISGIFKPGDYHRGHFEKPPYNESELRSVYHIRETEVHKLTQIAQPLDVFMSHDWPRGIAYYGNTELLLRRKPFLREEIRTNVFGSPPSEQLLHHLQPDFWFSAHMHTKFPAIVKHGATGRVTKFLALDKVGPRRHYLQVLDFPEANGPKTLRYDEEWLAILRSTNALIQFTRGTVRLPDPSTQQAGQRVNYRPTEEELEWIRTRAKEKGLDIPNNFDRTVNAWNPATDPLHRRDWSHSATDPQRTALLNFLELPDLFAQYYSNHPDFLLPLYSNFFQVSDTRSGYPAGSASNMPIPRPAVLHNPEEIDLEFEDDATEDQPKEPIPEADDPGSVASGGAQSSSNDTGNEEEIQLDI